MKCERDGCDREASHAPKLNVPALGWPIEAHAPLGVLIGMKVCARHFGEFVVKELLTPEIKKILEIAATNRCPPDFSRAWLSKVRLDSAEWLVFERASGDHGRLQ